MTENIKYVIFLAKRRFENFKLIKISWEKGCQMLDYNAAEWEHFQKMAEPTSEIEIFTNEEGHERENQQQRIKQNQTTQ